MKVTVYWLTNHQATIRKIRDKFGLPQRTSINGETVGDISEDMLPLLQECERRKFLTIRKKK